MQSEATIGRSGGSLTGCTRVACARAGLLLLAVGIGGCQSPPGQTASTALYDSVVVAPRPAEMWIDTCPRALAAGLPR